MRFLDWQQQHHIPYAGITKSESLGMGFSNLVFNSPPCDSDAAQCIFIGLEPNEK